MEQVTPDSMSFPWVFAHMKSPWNTHGVDTIVLPWYCHGKPMVMPW